MSDLNESTPGASDASAIVTTGGGGHSRDHDAVECPAGPAVPRGRRRGGQRPGTPSPLVLPIVAVVVLLLGIGVAVGGLLVKQSADDSADKATAALPVETASRDQTKGASDAATARAADATARRASAAAEAQRVARRRQQRRRPGRCPGGMRPAADRHHQRGARRPRSRGLRPGRPGRRHVQRCGGRLQRRELGLLRGRRRALQHEHDCLGFGVGTRAPLPFHGRGPGCR